MKYQMLPALLFIAMISLANREVQKKGTTAKLDSRYVVLKNSAKGELLLDRIECKFKIRREGVQISVVNNNFFLEFPDGRTAVGVIEKTSRENPPCFHTLTKKRPNKDLIITAYGSREGMKNCLRRHTSPPTYSGLDVTATFSYLMKKNYKKNCLKDLSNCRAEESRLEIGNGSGLTFYKSNRQSGSNVTRADLKFDEKYLSKCIENSVIPLRNGDHKATSPTPVK